MHVNEKLIHNNVRAVWKRTTTKPGLYGTNESLESTVFKKQVHVLCDLQHVGQVK